ncbi:MAG: family 78 glycoside hydrolase catalytic domain [Acidimicrobiales bacterium]|nr:family 78 glycoside hydrolase catalytic domain [Acidimicrobiales bacterium]
MGDRTGPAGLRCEHLDGDAIGVWNATPRLSWQLPAGRAQSAYQIALDDGRSVQIESDRHVLVAWPFEPLTSRERVTWRVRAEVDGQLSPWSDPSTIEAGLLVPEDWTAEWIEPDEDERQPPGQRPAWVLRTRFSCNDTNRGARLYATAHGVYEVYLNDRRVGDHELAPGFTSYGNSLHVQTYEVEDLLVRGVNKWEVILSDGWYRGRHGNAQLADGYGETVGFLGQLEVAGEYLAGSDASWEAAPGPILAADLMTGQVEDQRRELGPWRPTLRAAHGFSQLTSSPAPPVRRVQEIVPRSVTSLDNGRQIVDLGQNITGWVRLRNLASEGTEISLAHGEALDASGDVTTTHLEPLGRPLGQVDRVISPGRPDAVFEPRHTVHGFQYVRIEGHPERLTPADLDGVVVHTDLRRTGWFSCSDERLNRLLEIADWSFRTNACDIPTDCPHRERSGWTGDWLAFLPTGSYLYDVAGFSLKWLRDLAAEQLDNGLLPNYAPDPRRRRALAEGDLSWSGLFGSAGWADACVLVPWELYQRYGDDGVLAEMWPTMTRWLDYAAELARTARHPSRQQRSARPAPHEAFLWDGGWQFGEWCEPLSDGPPWYEVDQGHVATAYLHRSARVAAAIGRILGDRQRVAEFEVLSAGALDAWQAEYVTASGEVTPATQANLVRALAFDLVPEPIRSHAANQLVELVRAAGMHLGTGFLATPYLLPVLADHGKVDTAYDVLLQETPPSWLTMIDRGATTVWEEWEGIDGGGVAHASLNHYSKGAVVSFLYSHIAGIRPIEGELSYRRFRVAPHPGGGIEWAEAALDTPRGRIEVSWRKTGNRFNLDVTVPPGTMADIELPDGSTTKSGPGTSTHQCTLR